MEEAKIVWTDYMKYRLKLRSYDLSTIEHILRYSSERYVDTASGRLVVIGVHGKLLVMIPYECKGDTLTPVTIHTTNRQQINSRLKSGRLKNEPKRDGFVAPFVVGAGMHHDRPARRCHIEGDRGLEDPVARRRTLAGGGTLSQGPDIRPAIGGHGLINHPGALVEGSR